MTAEEISVLSVLAEAAEALTCDAIATQARRKVPVTYRTLVKLHKSRLVEKEQRIDGSVPRLYYRCTSEGARALIDEVGATS